MNHDHVAPINAILTPSDDEVRNARAIVSAFDEARTAGLARVEVGGSLVEVPTYTTAKRLLDRAAEFEALN